MRKPETPRNAMVSDILKRAHVRISEPAIVDPNFVSAINYAHKSPDIDPDNSNSVAGKGTLPAAQEFDSRADLFDDKLSVAHFSCDENYGTSTVFDIQTSDQDDACDAAPQLEPVALHDGLGNQIILKEDLHVHDTETHAAATLAARTLTPGSQRGSTPVGGAPPLTASVDSDGGAEATASDDGLVAMSLSLAVPLHAADVSRLAAILKVRELPPQHAILANPTADARINIRALEIEALRLRFGEAFPLESLLGDRAVSTLAIQSKAATRFVRWMAAEGLNYPVTVADVIRYLSALANDGIVWSGIQGAKYGIESLARAVGVGEHITHHLFVRRALGAIGREHGVRPTHQREAFLPDDLRRALPYFEELASTQPLRAARDLALLSVGIATALRGAELAAVRLEAVQFSDRGMVCTITKGKTLQHANDAEHITVTRIDDTRLCPVAAYERYAKLARLDIPGPMFRGLARNGWFSKRSGITPKDITNVVKAVGEVAGLDPKGISAHSLRIGSANAARRAGLSRDQIKRVTRHKNDRVLEGYMRPQPFDQEDMTGRLFE